MKQAVYCSYCGGAGYKEPKLDEPLLCGPECKGNWAELVANSERKVFDTERDKQVGEWENERKGRQTKGDANAGDS